MSKRLKFKDMDDIQEQGYRVVQEDEDLEEIICHIKERAIITGDSISALATAINIRRQTLHYYIENPKLMPVYLAVKLAKVLDCTVEDLFELGKDSWLIDVPPVNLTNKKEFLNLISLEMVTENQKHALKDAYYSSITGEKITISEYKSRLKEIKAKYPNNSDKELEFKEEYKHIYARLTRDMSYIANS